MAPVRSSESKQALRPGPSALLLLFVCVLTWLGGGAAIAQSERSPSADEAQPEEFFEVIDVDLVNIDVWVTDRNGNPIGGLTKEDFIVLRDKKPIEISNFYAVADGRDVTSRTASVLEQPSEPLETSTETLVAQELLAEEEVAPEHRLWLIVYIDNYNLDPIERDRVLPGVREFLARTLKGDDRAMVVSFDRGLEVLQPFTRAGSNLFSALDDVRGVTGHEGLRRRQQAETLQRIDRARTQSQALGWALQYAEEQLDNIRRTTEAMERMIESLAGLPGRKAFVHVSSGVPMLAGEEMFHAVGEKFNSSEAYAEIPRYAASRDFERLNQHANAHRVSFYTLDAGGMRGLHFSGAEYAGFINPRLRTTLDSIVPENLQSSLRFMAEETGGQAIVNRNEVMPALQKAALDFRSFYSLGITSAGEDSGSYHEIQVKLSTPNRKLRVRHRGGYRSKNTDARVRETLRSALLYSHQANPLGIDVTWGVPERQSGSSDYILPIQLRIPMNDIVLLPVGGGRHETRLRLFVGAAGKDGELSQIDDAPLGLRIADENVEAAKGEALIHGHRLRLGPGRKKVGIALVDLFGHEVSVVTSFQQIGAEQPR